MPRVHLPDGRIVNFPDGMSETDIAQAMADLAGPSKPAEMAPQEPSMLSRLGQAAYNASPIAAAKTALGLAKEHPIETGALIGGAVAAPLTGGASIPAAMAAAGLGGAGGAGLGMIANAAGGNAEGPTTARGVLGRMASEGAMQAGGEGVGQAASKLLTLGARGAYRVALAPTQKVLGKYGDIVGEGLDTATPVSKAGLVKAGQTKATRMATKANALSEADQRVGFSANQIANDASGPLSDYSLKQVRAGLPDPSKDFGDRLTQFKLANPNGTLRPTTLDQIQGTLNDEAGGAFRKIRMREPLTTQDKGTVEMLGAMKRAQASAVPNIADLNRSIMDAEGLRQAIQRRTVGSGGNQVLDTLLMLMRGPAGIPGRVAMLPPVLSGAAIGASRVAPALPTVARGAAVTPAAQDLLQSLVQALGGANQ